MIELQDIGFAYPRSPAPLFVNLRLSLPRGTICGLLGPNGAGKSTLLKMLGGLISPHQGTCRVVGMDPTERLPSLLADIFLLPEVVFVPAILISTFMTRYAAL